MTPELFGRFLELGSMDLQQIQLALKDSGRIDDESGLLEFIQEIEQERVGLVRRIRVVELRQRAVELGIPDHESRGRVIRMTVFPIRRKHELRTMPPDGAGDEPPVLGGIDQSAIWQV